MIRYAKLYLVTLTAYLLLDYLWLGILTSEFYNVQLGTLARRGEAGLDIVWWAAAIVYLMIPAGLILFVLPKRRVFLSGFAYGLILYGVYDFTNYATLSGWPMILVVVDTLWGGIVCGVCSFVAGQVNRKLP